VPVLLEAARKLCQRGYMFRLKIVGDGPDRARLEAMADSLDVRSRVVFTGSLRREDLEEALREVSVIVMPTLMEETAGLTAIEQMMRGRLVVASDIGGLAEVVDGAGLKFAVGDASALTECLEQLFVSPQLAIELGEKARRRALQYFVDSRMVAEHLAVYRQVPGG